MSDPTRAELTELEMAQLSNKLLRNKVADYRVALDAARTDRDRLAAEVERLRGLVEGAKHLAESVKVRIAFVGMPQEQRDAQGRPNWIVEIAELETFLARIAQGKGE